MNLASRTVIGYAAAAALAVAGFAQTSTGVKAEAKAKQLSVWGTDPAIVGAVKAYNASKPPAAASMTQETWKGLSLLDPTVRALSKNPAALSLKSKKDATVSEAFISGADGTKVAFLSKPSGWSHKGKEKHDVPMKGRVWVGSVEVDESSGTQQVQVSFPVLDGGKPIGSVVVGLKASAL